MSEFLDDRTLQFTSFSTLWPTWSCKKMTRYLTLKRLAVIVCWLNLFLEGKKNLNYPSGTPYQDGSFVLTKHILENFER